MRGLASRRAYRQQSKLYWQSVKDDPEMSLEAQIEACKQYQQSRTVRDRRAWRKIFHELIESIPIEDSMIHRVK